MSLRYRGNKNILDIVKNIDAFPKVPEEDRETSQIGGTLSVFSRILILILIYNEISYYREAKLVFKFQPDVDLDDKVKMNVDLVVAMPCIGLSGIDLIDETQQDVFSYGTLKRENTWWELTDEQQDDFNEWKQVHNFLKEEYHSIAETLYKYAYQYEGYLFKHIPERNEKLSKPYDACRLHGSLTINKVSGILHIVSGEQPLFGLSLDNHWHGEGFRKVPYNFTHRIYEFNFGDKSSRKLLQPLEADERIVPKDATIVQYFIEIVPTEIKNIFWSGNLYQYSVKENFRTLDSNRNSNKMPGIYIKYDWSALKVIVKQDRDNLTRFLIRLSSIISGIVVISGIINAIIQKLHQEILKFFAPYIFKNYKKLTIDPEDPPVTNKPLLRTIPTVITNDLINNANTMNLESIPIKTIPR